MIVLGIDPGTRFCGYALLKKENSSISLLTYDCLRLSSQKSLPERVFTIANHFDLLMKERGVTDLSLETPFLGKNAQNFLKLGYVRGILYFLAQKHKINIHEFSPREVKASITGFGGAQKEQVSHIIYKIFPRLEQGLRDDITDALAISLCGAWENRIQKFLQQSQLKMR